MTERLARLQPTSTEFADLETAISARDKIELRVWLSLLTCANLGAALLRRKLRERFATTLPRFDVLAQLARATDGLGMSELSQRLMVTNGNATGLVARLVADGVVQRTPTAADPRRQRVRLTARGRREFKAIAKAHSAWMEEIMADLRATELNALAPLLGALKASLKNRRQRS